MTEENMFGKQRGRFDEMMASRNDRSLTDKAIAAICAMNAEDMACFVDRFNRVFWHPDRGYRIMKRGGASERSGF